MSGVSLFFRLFRTALSCDALARGGRPSPACHDNNSDDSTPTQRGNCTFTCLYPAAAAVAVARMATDGSLLLLLTAAVKLERDENLSSFFFGDKRCLLGRETNRHLLFFFRFLPQRAAAAAIICIKTPYLSLISRERARLNLASGSKHDRLIQAVVGPKCIELPRHRLLKRLCVTSRIQQHSSSFFAATVNVGVCPRHKKITEEVERLKKKKMLLEPDRLRSSCNDALS